LADLHAFNAPEFKQVGLAVPPTELFDGFSSYSIYKSLFILGRCTVSMTVLAPKIEGFEISPKPQKENFLENGFCDSDQISVIY
jgi:hypothetical protein